MHILGIYLVNGDKSVIKNLRPNCWYPIYDLETFKTEPHTSVYSDKESFYKLEDSDTTNISISCIVGQNGSGKSTLLDVLYRIINNFSWHIKNTNKNLPTQIYYAYGFHAKLYFEIYGRIGYIEIVANAIDKKHCHDKINWNNDGDIQHLAVQKFNLNRLQNFFYTIVTNYSLYSFSPDDYVYKTKYFSYTDKNENFFYPKGIFNKNDGYISPIVLLPYRDEYGKILTDNENDLAIQRIIALSIYLYKKHGTSLIENKIPYSVTYSFNYDYDMEKYGFYDENKPQIDNISKQWEKHFKSELNKFNEKQREIILFYLGYKTFKFIMHYGFYNEYASQTEEEKERIVKAFNENHIKTIIEDDKSFMTLKIRQTYYYIQSPLHELEKGSLAIDTYFKDTNFKTIDDYFVSLPPPFYTYDLTFKDKFKNDIEQKNDDFSLNKMSSGEKQILFNLSYVLYHLKNLSTKSNLISSHATNATPVYKNAVLIFDEAELYMHPEYQRQYIYRMIKFVQNCHFENIKNMHIIFASHSPYLLSDIPSSNVLMLDDGQIRQTEFVSQTFSANIYDLLKYQFFMTSPVGEFARAKIQKIIRMLEAEKKLQKKELSDIKQFITTIGDDYVRKTLEALLKKHLTNNEGYFR